MPFYDLRDEPEVLRDAQLRAKKPAKTPQDALVAKRLGDIYSRHPYMQVGVALSLAESGADMAMVDQVAARSALVGYQKTQETADGTKKPTDVPPQLKEGIGTKVKEAAVKAVWNALKWVGGNTLGRNDMLKTASRWTLAALEFPKEYIANYGSLVTDPEEDAKRASAGSRWLLPEGMFASTSLGAMLQHGDKSGSGFMVGGEAEEKRVEKVKKFRWQLNGESYTVGRGTANMVATPGSSQYKLISGLIDGIIAFKADPGTPLGKAAKEIKAAKAAIPALESADEIAAAAKLAKGSAGLLSTAEQHAIDTSKFFNWLDNSGYGKRIVRTATDETDAYRMLEAFDFRISVDDAARLAAAKTEDQVRGIIADAATRLKDETEASMIPFATDARQLPASKRIPAYKIRNQSRWLAEVPDEYLIVHGTPEERIKAVKNLGNYLKTIKVDPYSGDGKKLMNLAIEAFSEDGTRVNKDIMARAFLGDQNRGIKGIVQMALEESGHEPEQIAAVLDDFRAGLQTLRKYAHDLAGATDDNGFMIHMTQFMDDNELMNLLKEIHPTKVHSRMTRTELEDVVRNLQPGELTVHGPMALSQMLNNVVVLPDPRQLRRMTNNVFFRLTKDGRELGAKTALTYFQQEVWRPYALMTFGYLVRNTMDASLRTALHGISTNNPFDYLMMALGRRGLGTISEGRAWTEAGSDLVGTASDLADYERWTRQTAARLTDDPAKTLARLVRDGQVSIVEPSDVAYGQGLIDTARRMHASPEQRFYAQIMHLPADKQKQLFVKWLDSASREAKEARKTIVDYLVDGPVVGNVANGRNRTFAPIAGAASMTTDEIVEAWFEVGNKWQVDNFTQMTDELRTVMAYNDVPVAAAEVWDEATTRAYSLTGRRPRPGELLVDDITIDPKDPQFRYWRVLETDATPSAGGKTVRKFKVIEVTDPGAAFVEETGSSAMNDFIRKRLEQNANRLSTDPPLVPPRVTMNVRREPATSVSGVTKGATATAQAIAKPARWWFDHVVTNWERAVDRSAPFKMSYYRAVADNAHLLSPDEATRLLDNIDEFAQRTLPELYAKNPEAARTQWIGGKQLYDDVKDAVDQATTRGNGVGTVEQLQDYASVRARKDLEDLFFTALNQNNLTDATKLIAPFGGAWANVAGRYAREIIEDPSRLRRTQLVYTGLENADPDNDGRGFIWKDPTTGQMKFTFPLYGRVTRAITGIPGIEWAAPVSRLSAGFQAIPGVGPVVQFAASDVFDRFAVPGTDQLRKLVTPFGDVGLKSMIPGALQKAWSALLDSPDKLETVYGSTYVDVFRHLSATGEYNLADSDDVSRLNKDAKDKARKIAMLRAIGQFVGPTASSPDYRFKKGSGEYYYTSELINWFRDEQAKNYDTAVENFLNTFGDQALIYVTGKTKLEEPYKGIEATEQFALWEKQNSQLLRDYKRIAGYLAPGGTESDFAMPIWSRQIAAGMRKRVDPRDQLAAAQYSVGAALVRARRRSYGPEISADEKADLDAYREEIKKKYPGFETAATFDTKGFDKMLRSLRELLADERTQDDPVAKTARQYLELRDQAVAALKTEEGVTLGATKNERASQLRTFLYNTGETLSAQNPDFSRLWQRELSAEVED